MSEHHTQPTKENAGRGDISTKDIAERMIRSEGRPGAGAGEVGGQGEGQGDRGGEENRCGPDE